MMKWAVGLREGLQRKSFLQDAPELATEILQKDCSEKPDGGNPMFRIPNQIAAAGTPKTKPKSPGFTPESIF